MITTHLKKRLKLPLEKILRFYLLVELTLFRHEPLIESDLDLLAFLVQSGQQLLPAFCSAAARHFHPTCADTDLATRAQNIRNRLVKLEKRKLVIKSRPGSKTLIEAADFLQVVLDKPLLLDYQFLSSEAAQTL